MSIATELLRRFCACPSSDSRECLHRPWRADGRIYAANGAMLVAIPDDGRLLADPVGDVKDVRKIVASLPAEGYGPIPALPDADPCATCDGIGLIGGAPCWDCCGVGDCFDCSDPKRRIRIGSDEFQARLLRLLAQLPDVQIAPGLPLRAAGIRFTGGFGALMPLDQPSIRKAVKAKD